MLTHTDTAIAVARDTGWNVDEEAQDRGWTSVGMGPVGQHRDSGALDRSNFRVVLADLTTRFGDAVADVRFGHWAVGWVEEIIFDAGRADVVDAVQSWRDALADYPVADEVDFSDLEHDELMSWLDQDASWLLRPLYLRDDAPDDWISTTLDALPYVGSVDDFDCDAFRDAAVELGFAVEDDE